MFVEFYSVFLSKIYDKIYLDHTIYFLRIMKRYACRVFKVTLQEHRLRDSRVARYFANVWWMWALRTAGALHYIRGPPLKEDIFRPGPWKILPRLETRREADSFWKRTQDLFLANRNDERIYIYIYTGYRCIDALFIIFVTRAHVIEHDSDK